MNCTALTTITVSEGVSRIEDDAFWSCESLQSVSIPNSLTYLGEDVFANCYSLYDYGYTYYSNCCYLGNSSNRYLALICANNVGYTSYTINSSTKFIANGAMSNLSKATSLTIPKNVIQIGSGAFSGCTSLKTISVASDNTAYKAIDGNLYTIDGKELIQYAIGKTATSFTVPSGVEKIAHVAFQEAVNLTSVTIPSSVTTIGDGAFNLCTNLSSVSLAHGLTTIESSAFMNCTSLRSITLPNTLTYIGALAFSGTNLSSANFKSSGGYWIVVSSPEYTSGDRVSVSSIYTAATYLKSTYASMHWKKVPNA